MLVVKNLPANEGDIKDVGLIPGSGRFPTGGHSNPLQYSCLENPMDRGEGHTELDTTEVTYQACSLAHPDSSILSVNKNNILSGFS